MINLLAQLLARLGLGPGLSQDDDSSGPEVSKVAIFSHATLGDFYPNANPDWTDVVEGSWQWCGRDVSLTLMFEEGTVDQAADQAVLFLAKETEWAVSFGDHMYQEMYETWLDGWRDEKESLSKEEWLARLSLDNLEIDSTGDFTAMYNDGNLFGGHSLVVEGSQKEGVLGVSMFG